MNGSSSVKFVSQGCRPTSFNSGSVVDLYQTLYPAKSPGGMPVQFHFTLMVVFPVAVTLKICGTKFGAKNRRKRSIKSNYHYSYNRFYCNCILGSKYCLRFYVVENQNQSQQRCITWFNLRYTVACHCFIATVKCVYKRSVIIYRLRVGGGGGEGGRGD